MTKREICERLLAIWEMEPYKNTAEAIKHLLLDIAAPEEEPKSKEDEKMKLFISQPMRGKTDAEIEAERAKIIEEAKKRFGNVEVIDSFFAGQDTSNPVLCLSKALEKLAGADIIWFAPGWERANGCNIEHEVAKRYLGDKHIVEADAKYIVHCEANIGSGCMFSSFGNGRTFERGEKNAKVFDRRESAEEEIDLDEILFPALCAMGARFLKKCAELDAKQKAQEEDER